MGIVCGKTPNAVAATKSGVVLTEATPEDVCTTARTERIATHKPKLQNFDSDYVLRGSRVGQGQFASVQIACHQRILDARFAVKTMKRSAEDLDRQSAREAEVWKKLDNPFIAK